MKKAAILFLFFWLISFSGCGIPQYFWPQDDIGSLEINPGAHERKILIASRKSEFKTAIVDKTVKAFEGKDVYIKVIGIEDLAKENAEAYTGVLLINTCMAWAIDRHVESWLEKYGNLESIIVLTTADGSDIFPNIEGSRIDAMSSASADDKINPLAEELIGRIRRILSL